MTDNVSLLSKADLALSDLASNGGLLTPSQTDTFIRVLIDSPTIFNSCRVVPMPTYQHKISKIGFGSRILRAGVSGTALDAADRVKPSTSQIVLNSKEVIAEVHIPYDVMEDNIEGGSIAAPMGGSGGGLQDTIVAMIAERAALDLEELFILGDTATIGDSYLALTDGVLKRCTAHVVDVNNVAVSKAMFKAAKKAMPDKYLRDVGSLRHLISVDNDTEYRDSIAGRATPLGDATLQGNNQIFAFGTPIAPVPLMPNTKGLFTNPLNLIAGIQRKINIEFDKDIRARNYIIVLTARVDFQVEEIDAAVKYINIGGN